jgi:hypothetical protein
VPVASRRGDHARLADRKRLLLDGLHVTLKEVIVERTVGVGIAFQVGYLRLGNSLRQFRLSAVLALLGNLIVALVGLRNASKLVENGVANVL